MNEVILNISGLTRRFGSITAVDALDLEVRRGEVYGILGPNGSGKTTTLGIVLGVVNRDKGSFTWFGQEPSARIRQRVGSTLEMPLFYPYLNGTDNLKIVADIRGCSYDFIDNVLQRVGLFDRRYSRFRTYSLGMKQRLAIAGAMLGNPEVMIFDEPTNGLDPQGIAEIRELILSIAAEGKTIIMASHLLDEVEKTCTHVAVLKKGKKVFSGKVSELLRNELVVELRCDLPEKLTSELKNWNGCAAVSTENGLIIVKLNQGFHAGTLNRYAFDNGIEINHLAIRHESLEKHFLELLAEHQ
ncbi:MAG: ABC transporter ATP-binding protein [Bacteroidetes bacterium]|nr:ABC transporter ATP-binding protein [Bacteroidota bacterium]